MSTFAQNKLSQYLIQNGKKFVIPAPTFAGISSSRTVDATVVRVPGPPMHFRISRGTAGWIVAAGPPLVPIDNILFRLAESAPGSVSMRFAMSEPSRVVAVADPDTGGTLLVGTQAVSGQASQGKSAQPQFILLPTLQGLVVAPNSDDIRMRREPDGFSLSAGPAGGGTGAAAWQGGGGHGLSPPARPGPRSGRPR